MIDLHRTILLAADDWFQIVGGIIVMVMWGIQQIFANRQEAKDARPKKVRRPRKAAAGQPVDGAPPPNQADPLRAEVEQFLRQTEEKKGQPNRPGEPRPRDTQQERVRRPAEREQRPIQREPLPGSRERQRSKRPAEKARKPKTRQARAKRGSEASGETVDLGRENVEQHVARHLSTKKYEERAEHLGEKVALADDRLEARLEQTFDHSLGNLTHAEVQVEETGPSVADEIRQLISEPQGMRQLIIANEILRRPEERW